MVQQPVFDEQNLTLQFLFLDTLRKMRDASANSDDHRYYTYFKFSIRLCMGYLDIEQREKIEIDFNKLQGDIELLINTKDKNEETKKFEIRTLKTHFAESHEYYLMSALPRLGIVRVADDGLIDFAKEDIRLVKRIVRAGSGLPSAIKEGVKIHGTNGHVDKGRVDK